MDLVYILSCIPGLAGAAAIILTAVLVYRGFVQHKPVTPAQVMTAAILAIVAGALRVILSDLYYMIDYLFSDFGYAYLSSSTICFLVYHMGLVAAGILLLCSKKKPHLARTALGVQILSLLSLAVLYFGLVWEMLTYYLNYMDSIESQWIYFDVLPFLCTCGLAVYPIIVWFQSGKRQ